MDAKTYFVTGIDTDAGKSVVTGWLASQWQKQGLRVITQKFIQTGNTDLSEDILLHRRLMNSPLLEEDRERLTMPEIFKFPASPHLAARLENRSVDLDKIASATRTLQARYDRVLIEGAGGLMVPISEQFLTIDYIKQQKLPIILVTNAKLGSINHTLLALDVISSHNIELATVVFNQFEGQANPTIAKDTQAFIFNHIKTHYPQTAFLITPHLGNLTSSNNDEEPHVKKGNTCQL